MAKSRKEQIEEMLRETPEDHELRYMLAMEHVSEGDDAGAVRVFQELIAGKPDYPPAYHMGARALQRQGKTDEARRLLQQGIPVALSQGNHHAAGEMQELMGQLE